MIHYYSRAWWLSKHHQEMYHYGHQAFLGFFWKWYTRAMRERIIRLDTRLIHTIQTVSLPLARVSMFVVLFWFGLLKVIGLSPAESLVFELFQTTILTPIPFDFFFIFLGILEMVIGIAFLIPGWERFAMALLIPHMITTILPLFKLPDFVWQMGAVPTLEGQYIIKNVVLISVGFAIAAHLKPFKEKVRKRGKRLM
jgi:uncharacterized membrane protein YkgB